MKRMAAGIIAIALAVGMTAAPAQAQSTSKDRKYLALVKGYVSTKGASDRQLVRMGKQVCKTFDAGATLYDIAEAVVESATTPQLEKLFAASIAAAVIVYCPEYQSELE